MSRADFCLCTPEEFQAMAETWNETRQSEERAAWERARLIAYMTAAPYLSRKMTPRQIFPLPWDAEAKKTDKSEVEHLTPGQQRKRFEELVRRVEG
ncbi:MAG: hypothetical protein ACI31E_01560 [Muribaculaceae bacterium]